MYVIVQDLVSRINDSLHLVSRINDSLHLIARAILVRQHAKTVGYQPVGQQVRRTNLLRVRTVARAVERRARITQGWNNGRIRHVHRN
jgi:hypothetical protein